jgi:hypothetical protein
MESLLFPLLVVLANVLPQEILPALAAHWLTTVHREYREPKFAGLVVMKTVTDQPMKEEFVSKSVMELIMTAMARQMKALARPLAELVNVRLRLITVQAERSRPVHREHR